VPQVGTSWVHPALAPRESPIHGRGVFSTSRLRRGERLAIFGGEVMLIDEIDSLPEELQDYPMQIEERFVLGSRGERAPETADFFNHSCNPTCGFKGQIFLVAMRDIEAGEEVTFDYAMVVSKSVGSSIVFEMPCRCRAAACRGVVTEEDWRMPALRARYRGYFSQYIAERIAAERGEQD
jgi:SET domain-containing protein